MSGHTPGPWHLEVDYPCSYNGEGKTGKMAICDGPDGFVIAVTVADVSEIAKAERSNARLIAAAPDLLSAMRFILAFYEPGQRHLDTEAWKRAEAAARAAVAKAEGRQP